MTAMDGKRTKAAGSSPWWTTHLQAFWPRLHGLTALLPYPPPPAAGPSVPRGLDESKSVPGAASSYCSSADDGLAVGFGVAAPLCSVNQCRLRKGCRRRGVARQRLPELGWGLEGTLM